MAEEHDIGPLAAQQEGVELVFRAPDRIEELIVDIAPEEIVCGIAVILSSFRYRSL